jgi:hypothetical protein
VLHLPYLQAGSFCAAASTFTASGSDQGSREYVHGCRPLRITCFDGNPSNLFPLSPHEEARRIADLVGGEDVLLRRAQKAVKSGNFQWAAQLTDHLLALNPEASEAKETKSKLWKHSPSNC